MPNTGHKAALALALVLTAPAVWADVTPEEVWENWQAAKSMGGTAVTADSTSMDGDTLTVTGITLTFPDVDGESGGAVRLETLQFQDNGDGTVAIVLPDSFPVTIVSPLDPITFATTETVLNVTMPDAEITASGVPDAISYDTAMPLIEVAADLQEPEGETVTLAIKLTDVTGAYLVEAAESGTNISQEGAVKTLDLSVKTKGATADNDVSVTLSLTDLAGKGQLTDIPAVGGEDLQLALNEGMTVDFGGSYGIGSIDVSGKDAGDPIKLAATVGGGNFVVAMAATTFHYDATSKTISLNLAGTDQVSGAEFSFSGALADLTSQLDMAGANWANTEDFDLALKAGLKLSGAFGLGATSFDFSSVEGGQMTKLKSSVGNADTSFAMEAAAMRYAFGSKAIALSVSTPEIPLPEVAIDLAELAFDLAMPLTKTGNAAPFTYLTRIVDLKIPEALWAMADPTGVLPHDPATIILDTKGMVTLTEDLVNDAMAGGPSTPPLLHALDLTQLLVKFAGAEVSANGAFTFDNTDTTTIPDMPYPTGKLDIRALGVNGLIDKLVAMGLLPEDQAMQGRMMMSMFANSSADRDELTSVLEFKDKHFYANGQQLQ